MPNRAIDLILRGYEDRSGFDTGVSHALLEQVSNGTVGETFRIATPGSVVAFGKRDVHSPGFETAVARARRHGYSPIIRLPGGRAAVFHRRTVSFSWTVPDPDPVASVQQRFSEIATVITRTLERLDIPSAIGAIDGEYCPGDYSVNHAGKIKLAGVGQRLARNASHVGGVLVVGDAARIRDVLIPVYAALDLDMDPSTIGAIDDVVPGVDVEMAIGAMIDTLSETAALLPREFNDATLERASEVAEFHVPHTSGLA